MTPARASVSSATTLTKREREVAALVINGLTYREIGEQLEISEKTVNAHVQAIAAKLPGPGRPIARIVRHAAQLRD